MELVFFAFDDNYVAYIGSSSDTNPNVIMGAHVRQWRC